MTESPRREGPDPTPPIVDYPDPAYAGQSPYNPAYPAAPAPGTNPTQQLPPGYQYGYGTTPGPSGEPAPESDDGGSRLWLWILAGLAVLAALALVIALVINNSSRQETVVAPQPVGPEPGAATTTAPRPTTPRTTPRTTRPVPPPAGPTTPATPGATETVTYEVSGEGRAINITYVDSGNMLQTEFNVMLPWSKQVELPQPAAETASVSVINFGPDVTCTVTVNGVQTQNRTGTGLTVCVGDGAAGPPR